MRQEIQDLLAKKDFSEGLLKLDDPSKVKDYFTTKGNLKDVTDEEIKELGLSLENLMQKISELPEDKLEKIGGGVDPNDSFDYLINLKPQAKELGDKADLEYDPDFKFKIKKSMSTGKKAGIGAAAIGTVAVAGAGLYKLGQKKGWWKGFSKN